MKIVTMSREGGDSELIRYTRSREIRIDCKDKNRKIPIFLAGTVILTILSLWFLDIPWLKLASRVPDVWVISSGSWPISTCPAGT